MLNIFKFENSQKMCEDSSSNIVGNPPSETDLGDGVNEVEDVMECEEDVALNGDDQYRIDGMEDIGRLCNLAARNADDYKAVREKVLIEGTVSAFCAWLLVLD
ncbi:hypothetical protein RIF29_07795 [Crotalaria pallida]|uniref:Uncharacterized protein n=1 Tax=Crotalaria pallida TaxID=3830 RepID=A0AAN9PAZ2_CROPI